MEGLTFCLIIRISDMDDRSSHLAWRILVVDDDPLLRAAFVRLLRRASLDVRAVVDGMAALVALAEDDGIELVITDQHMPGMLGSELLVIAQERFPDVRRVLLTGDPPPELPALLDAGVVERCFLKSRLSALIEWLATGALTDAS